MKEPSATAGHALLAAALALAMAGCGNPPPDAAADAAPAADAAAPTQGEGTGSGSTSVEAPAGDASASAGFDIASVPVSNAALGDFPYLQLPDRYIHYSREGSDFDRVPFWTGDGIEWVEGRVFGSRVTGDEDQGKTFALLEFQRNMQAAIRQAGGQQVAEGRIPRELRDAMEEADPDLGVRYNAGRGDIWNRPVETFVIRRPDRQIWIQMTGYEHSGNLLIAETQPVQITAGLLPATALKDQIDADGRVAIEVHFAVDEADILPESRPQVEQVLELLRGNPDLRLSVEGHTDSSGDAAHNQGLSERRAAAVVAELVRQGIEPARLASAGHGASRPVASNADADGQGRNRRVELVKM